MNCKKTFIVGILISGILLQAKIIDLSKYPHKISNSVSQVEKKAKINFKTNQYKKEHRQLEENINLTKSLQDFIAQIIIIKQVYPQNPKKVSNYLKDKFLNEIKLLENKIKQFKGNKILLNMKLIEKIFTGNIKAAEKLKLDIKKNIALNNFVSARLEMNIFEDEIDEHIFYAGKKETIKYLEKMKKFAKKGNVLSFLNIGADFINSVKDKIIVYPLPFIKIQALLNEVEHAIYSKHFNKEEVMDILKEAKYQIELADVLGYLPYESSLKEILEYKIERLQNIVNNDKKSISLIKKIKNIFKQLKVTSFKHINL